MSDISSLQSFQVPQSVLIALLPPSCRTSTSTHVIQETFFYFVGSLASDSETLHSVVSNQDIFKIQPQDAADRCLGNVARGFLRF